MKGYTNPLYVLPFDHRHSYGKEVFDYAEPMTKEQTEDVAHSKQVIYAGFTKTIHDGLSPQKGAILVDQEFGSAILKDARAHGYNYAMPVEKSGQDEFDFEYGDQFKQHIEDYDPTFVKVLVRYNVEADATMNARQNQKLKTLSDYLIQTKRPLLFELLVPAEKSQLAKLNNDKKAYDEKLRPQLMVQAIETLQKAGVEPDIWKIEGLDHRPDCEAIVKAARSGGRSNIGIIVLGRGENEAKVLDWLKVAAPVPGFIGFAVGRSSFLQSILDLRHQKIDRATAVQQIAAKYQEWIKTFEAAKSGSPQ